MASFGATGSFGLSVTTPIGTAAAGPGSSSAKAMASKNTLTSIENLIATKFVSVECAFVLCTALGGMGGKWRGGGVRMGDKMGWMEARDAAW